jgi:hypothetical protein
MDGRALCHCKRSVAVRVSSGGDFFGWPAHGCLKRSTWPYEYAIFNAPRFDSTAGNGTVTYNDGLESQK